jgi:uncharacterized membrane protein
MTVRNPVEWGSDHLNLAATGVKSAIDSIHRPEEEMRSPAPAVRRIAFADLRDALAKGFLDFTAYRTDVIFLCVIYPVIGLVLARLVIGEGMFQLLFPLASGFALIGPFIGIGLYEMSRRREQGDTVSWATAFRVLHSPSAGAIALLGLLLMAIFVAWLFVAEAIYGATMGTHYHPASIATFAQDVFTTGAGWTLIAAGVGAGFLFAMLVFVLTVVSFPLLIDRQDVGLDVAIRTSIRAVVANPGPMALWGIIVAGSLVLGSIPLFVGLALVMPVLGHATWHLYRKLAPR